jgi:hypothetical protein
VRDAFAHLKFIGVGSGGGEQLLEAAGLADKRDAGVVTIAKKGDVDTYVKAAARQRLWDREPKVRTMH